MSEQDFALAKVSSGTEVVRRGDAVGQSGLVAVEQARAVQEVQAKLIIAKRFPRNEMQAVVDIMQACKRPSLAKVALYTYERGGKTIQAAGIRLAEVVARAWGNIDFGIRELTQGDGYSDVEAYAWDLQTNTTAIRSFKVQHRRYTKAKTYDLEDPRDIYEAVANYGVRRMRACMFEIIPGDILEDAVKQIRETLMQAGKAEGPIEDRIKKMALAFNGLGVSVEAIEGRLKHKIELTTEEELIELRGIFNSLNDGMSKRTDFFELGGGVPTTDAKKTPGKRNPTLRRVKAAEAPKGAEPPSPGTLAEPPKSETPKADPPKTEPSKEGPQGNTNPTAEQIKANLQRDPFSCPKTGEPLGKVDCAACEVIATCQAMSGEANPAPPQEAAPVPPPPPAEPKERKKHGQAKDATLVCGYAKMEPLYGKNVYMKYCQQNCKHRTECPTLKAHGGPTK